MKFIAIALALALTPTAAVAAPAASAIDVEEDSRFKIRNVRIDGKDDVVKVRQGGVHRVSMDVLHDCGSCGNAVNQIIVGLAGQDKAQVSVWNGKQRSGGGAKRVNGAVAEDNPGAAQWVTVEFDITVPADPGAYPIRARYAQAYHGRLLTAEGRAIAQQEYPDPLGWWKVDRPNGPDAKSTIGYVIVVP